MVAHAGKAVKYHQLQILKASKPMLLNSYQIALHRQSPYLQSYARNPQETPAIKLLKNEAPSVVFDIIHNHKSTPSRKLLETMFNAYGITDGNIKEVLTNLGEPKNILALMEALDL